MEAKINIIEVASELAKERVIDDYQTDNLCDREEAEANIVEWDESETISNYTEWAQDSFNYWYDHYFGLITDLVL